MRTQESTTSAAVAASGALTEGRITSIEAARMAAQRGCGSRVDQALYATVPSSPFGKSIDYFLVDPAIKFGARNLRAPMVVPDPQRTHHVILGVGKTYYPTVPDFVEEARVMGISKRLPKDFDPGKLTPGKSKLLLFHPKAIPAFYYEKYVADCPTNKTHRYDETVSRTAGTECIGDLWPLSVYERSSDKHKVTAESVKEARIRTPSTTYKVRFGMIGPKINGKDRRVPPMTIPKDGTVPYPKKPLGYLGGIFLSFPTFNFTYVAKSGQVPKDVADRIAKPGYKLEVAPE